MATPHLPNGVHWLLDLMLATRGLTALFWYAFSRFCLCWYVQVCVYVCVRVVEVARDCSECIWLSLFVCLLFRMCTFVQWFIYSLNFCFGFYFILVQFIFSLLFSVDQSSLLFTYLYLFCFHSVFFCIWLIRSVIYLPIALEHLFIDCRGNVSNLAFSNKQTHIRKYMKIQGWNVNRG